MALMMMNGDGKNERILVGPLNYKSYSQHDGRNLAITIIIVAIILTCAQKKAVKNCHDAKTTVEEEHHLDDDHDDNDGGDDDDGDDDHDGDVEQEHHL